MKNTLWVEVEGLSVSYMEANAEVREVVFGEIFSKMTGYLETCANNSANKAKANGVVIPFEDFFSNYSRYLWDAVNSFVEEGGKYTLKNLILKRFGYVERITWRDYSSKQDDGSTSYDKARWQSTDKLFEGEEGEAMIQQFDALQVSSAESVYIQESESEEDEIISEFRKQYPRHANVIHFMAKGYTGVELAQITQESATNDAKMRKLVQRSKELFRTFMENRIAIV